MKQQTLAGRRRRGSTESAHAPLLRMLVIAGILVVGAFGQVGETLCACQPSVWDIDLNFALSCDDETFAVGPGIEDTACLVAPRQENVTDFEFLQVSMILITERDQQRRVINQPTILPGDFSNGDSFSYTSYIDGNTDFNLTTLPREIQFDFNGINTLGELIRATWSLEFTNDCTVFPVVEAGDQTIISSITDVADPPGELCPISTPRPSSVPSSLRTTSAPSNTPSLQPTQLPSFTPTMSLLPTVQPPVVGVDICGCQPGEWDFMLDFTLTCDDATFNPSNPGIYDTTCQLFARDGNEVFETVTLITILELNQNLDVASQVSLPGPLPDGSTFSYTSLLNQKDSFNSTSLPRAIQMTILGTNSNGNNLVATWGVEFNNDCAVFPVVTDADETVITNVTAVANPPVQFCPAASAAPTLQPTIQPSSSPTEAATPTFEPTPFLDSDQPSQFPSDIPSEVVTEDPSGSPTETPSMAPTCPPVATMKPTSGKKSGKKSDGGKKPDAGKKSTGGKKQARTSYPTTPAPTTAKMKFKKGDMGMEKPMETYWGKKSSAYHMMVRGLYHQQVEDEMFHIGSHGIHHEAISHHSEGRDLTAGFYYPRRVSSSMTMKMDLPSYSTPTIHHTAAPTCPDSSMKSKKKSKTSGKKG